MLMEDHCRIGSLENFIHKPLENEPDHCRIGSLEMELYEDQSGHLDHCRIGSLEISFDLDILLFSRSLPHRQLRKSGKLDKRKP